MTTLERLSQKVTIVKHSHRSILDLFKNNPELLSIQFSAYIEIDDGDANLRLDDFTINGQFSYESLDELIDIPKPAILTQEHWKNLYNDLSYMLYDMSDEDEMVHEIKREDVLEIFKRSEVILTKLKNR